MDTRRSPIAGGLPIPVFRGAAAHIALRDYRNTIEETESRVERLIDPLDN